MISEEVRRSLVVVCFSVLAVLAGVLLPLLWLL